MPHPHADIKHLQHSHKNTKPHRSWGCVAVGQLSKRFTPTTFGRPEESCRSLWILRDFVIHFSNCVWSFFRLAHICPILKSWDYSMDPTEKIGESPPLAYLQGGLLFCQDIGSWGYSTLTFIVVLARAYNQAWCPETSTCTFMMLAQAPGCQSCQHA